MIYSAHRDLTNHILDFRGLESDLLPRLNTLFDSLFDQLKSDGRIPDDVDSSSFVVEVPVLSERNTYSGIPENVTTFIYHTPLTKPAFHCGPLRHVDVDFSLLFDHMHSISSSYSCLSGKHYCLFLNGEVLLVPNVLAPFNDFYHFHPNSRYDSSSKMLSRSHPLMAPYSIVSLPQGVHIPPGLL